MKIKNKYLFMSIIVIVIAIIIFSYFFIEGVNRILWSV